MRTLTRLLTFARLNHGAPRLASRARSRHLARGVVALASVSLVAGALAVAAPAVGSASADTPSTCSFATAGTGEYASTLCWFDLSTLNAAAASSASGQEMTATLPGGYTINYTVNTSGVAAVPVALPTWSGSFLGNNGAYTGIAGKPALYQTGAGSTTATLSDIKVVDSTGAEVTGYSFVGADAESTDLGESVTWTSNTPLRLLSPVGNACDSGANLTGVGTTTVKCAATANTAKTGTPILAAEHPSTLSQTMVGAGLQAVAFGVLVSTVQLTKSVASRISASDAFAVSVATPGGSVLSTANTGTGNTATTGQVTTLEADPGEQFVLSEAATSGTLADYKGTWACTRNGAVDPALPSGAAGASATVSVAVGDYVSCTITNTAKPTGLLLVKHAGTPTDVNGDGLTDAGDTIPYTFTVTNTGQLPLDSIAVADPTAGPVVCPASSLAVGASELCTAASVYTVTAADVAAGAAVNTATATGTISGTPTIVTSAPSSTSTPATAPRFGFSVAKTASVATVKPGGVVDYTVAVTNTGNANFTPSNPASFTDDLSGVLDDAAYDHDASVGATVTGDTLTWSGALMIGATTDVTYSVTVDNPDHGDQELLNAVVPDAANGGICAATGSCTTTTLVSDYAVAKTATPYRLAEPGDVVDYTIRVTNTGEVAYTSADPATFTDDLTNVLSFANYNNDASIGAIIIGPTLTWTGALPVGSSVSVTYSVTIKKNAHDGTMHNAVVAPADSGSGCVPGSTLAVCFTNTPVDPPVTSTAGFLGLGGISGLAHTGSDLSQWPFVLGLLLAAAGTALLFARRIRLPRRQEQRSIDPFEKNGGK